MSTLQLTIALVLIIIFLNFTPFPLFPYVSDGKRTGRTQASKGDRDNRGVDKDGSYWFKEGEFDTVGAANYCWDNQSRQLGIKEMVHVYDIGGSYYGQSQMFNSYERGVLRKEEGLGIPRLNDRNLPKGVWCYGVPAKDAEYSIRGSPEPLF